MSNRHYSSERLKSRRSIGRLFSPEGRSLAAYPIRVLYRTEAEQPGHSGVKVAFVVPKKRFKLAVKRNLLKRRMQEAYRLNKSILAGTQDQENRGEAEHHLLFMYTGKEEVSYDRIERNMLKLLKRLESTLSEA